MLGLPSLEVFVSVFIKAKMNKKFEVYGKSKGQNKKKSKNQGTERITPVQGFKFYEAYEIEDFVYTLDQILKSN